MTETDTTTKGQRTRTRILETAISLFRKKGYESTTVRDIAQTADVAVSNAYYYFGSKEELVLAFYERLNEEQMQLVKRSLGQHKSLKTRLIHTVRCKLETLSSHRDLCGSIFSLAVRPNSALSPFSSSTKVVRGRAISTFSETVEGSDTKVPEDLRAVLPTCLWLYYLAILFYWLHDTSPLQHKTNELLEQSAQIISVLVSISALPVMAPIRHSLLQMMTHLEKTS
jgi:AcrR family transcriptional regulator